MISLDNLLRAINQLHLQPAPHPSSTSPRDLASLRYLFSAEFLRQNRLLQFKPVQHEPIMAPSIEVAGLAKRRDEYEGTRHQCSQLTSANNLL